MNLWLDKQLTRICCICVQTELETVLVVFHINAKTETKVHHVTVSMRRIEPVF